VWSAVKARVNDCGRWAAMDRGLRCGQVGEIMPCE
jgi:hypothetical protein